MPNPSYPNLDSPEPYNWSLSNHSMIKNLLDRNKVCENPQWIDLILIDFDGKLIIVG